jgi:hypothetical protein
MAWRGIAARMEGRANLCGEVRAITVEAGEDVGAIRFGLMAISSWRCQLDFPGSRLSSVGQRPRAFRHGLRADAPRQVGLLRLAH